MAVILVVDDNSINRKLLTDLLSFEGHTVSSAADAEQAIVMLQGELPDLILMDVALPGMDGLTLTTKLKSEDRTKHIVIAAVTAFAMKGDEAKIMAAGCDSYISKPIDTRTLPKKVEELLKIANNPQ